MKTGIYAMLITLAVALASTNFTASAQSASDFAVGLKRPTKIIATPRGNFLVAGADTPRNSGQVSLIARGGGAHHVILGGLPSGLSVEGSPDGTTGLAIERRDSIYRRDEDDGDERADDVARESFGWWRSGTTLLVVNGIGDTTRFGTAPGTEVPNPQGLASPILSSLLRVRFEAEVDDIISPFTLTLADHFRLADGNIILLRNAEGNRASIELIADFRDLVPDARTIVRGAHPFGVALIDERIYVVDSGYNSIFKVALGTNRVRTLTAFAQIPNPTPVGAPTVDAVPDSIRAFRGELLVTYLTGFPFAAGAARVVSVNPETGAQRTLITGLTSAIDVLGVKGRRGVDEFFVLEFSANQLQGAPGRLKRFNGASSTPAVITAALITPTSMVRDADTGEFFITEIATGKIVRVQTQ